MLSLKFIRENTDLVRDSLAKKGEAAPIDEILALDEQRRKLITQAESLRARRNQVSQQIARAGEKPQDLIAEMRLVGEQIRALEAQLQDAEAKLDELLLLVPNIVHPSVPIGHSEEQNVVLRTWGDTTKLATGQPIDFEPLPHWEIGDRLGIIDFERGAKLAGSRFYVLRGAGARLERALINWMLDLHTTEHGYIEILPPFLVKRECMVGTGQLPKFEEDAYLCTQDDLFLNPTAEVPVTNLHRDEILESGSLPKCYAAYTACFRREAGAAGRDTKGVIRVHQFNKVELVKFVKPDSSYDELEKLLNDAEDVLQRLKLPYQIVEICSGDLGFAAAKKYDPEVWFPGQDRYIEVSSCSNFEDFQARRANIRYRPAPGARLEFVHTINGSGVAVGRTAAAILENYQQSDGTVVVPEVLRPYMGGMEVIR